MKFTAHFNMSRDEYDRSLYLDSAMRVIFKNCTTALDLDDKKLANFNRNFYYNQLDVQEKLQECYNTRIDLHFGHENAKNEHLHMDFKAMKREYQNYEMWHPMNRLFKPYIKGEEEEKVKSIIDHLHQKSAGT